MSLVGVRSKNHPQQTGKRGADDATDDRLGSPLRVEFLRGRMRFDRPDWTPGPKGDRPPFGCCLLIWDATRAARGEGEPT